MIVGIDEVGRGCWAGPLCVAAVGLGGAQIDGLNDSKKLTKKRRDELTLQIKQTAPLIGVGWVSARQIDEVGMSAALRSAASQALRQIDGSQIDQVIIDGTIKLIDDPRVSTLKQADLLIPSVSAASIIAKTARDDYMAYMDNIFDGYNFAKHVGYGTALHRSALEAYGTTPLHRMSFKPMSELFGLPHDEPVDTSAPHSPTSIGAQAETAAARYLTSLGYAIEMRNFKTKRCEIDIVARKQDRIYFVEVKYRRNNDQGGGMAAITPKKLRQMEFAARIWLQKYGIRDAALAAIEVSGDDFLVGEFIDQVQL